MRKISSASRKTYRKTMSYVNNYLNTTIIRTSWSSSLCKEKKNTMRILQNYERKPTLNMAWEVSIAYFRVKSLCDTVTKKYGYQEGLPAQDRSFLMPEEVSKLIEDQDKLFLKEQVHNESYQEEEDPCEDEALVFSLPFDEDIQSFVPLVHQKGNMESYNPFENFDDTLFHDFGNEEVLEEEIYE
jgi:hypothetical protein